MADEGLKLEEYARGLLCEEAGEIGQALGKATRFGIDTPGPAYEPYLGRTARQLIEMECGDVLAAIEWSTRAGLLDRQTVRERCDQKLAKLLNPENRDNLGRQLAPTLPALATLSPTRLRALEEALRPFAAWTDEELEGAPDDMPIGDALYEGSQPTVGDFRRARAALACVAGLPADVVQLVIAGRQLFDAEYEGDAERRAFFEALEAFSSRVPYEDEPDNA